MGSDILKKVLENLPKSPGVYIMKDDQGKIVYIGKAKNLRNRVRSYFNPGSSDTRFFVRQIRRLVDSVETILTHSEKEALLLENNLIKINAPRYNIRLRDDKEYLCLRLDTRTEWPKLEVVRRPNSDGANYFGPYDSAHFARQTLALARRFFKLRNCSDSYMKGRIRPCLQHQIRRCPGPCVLNVDRDEYMHQVEFARLFLLGRRAELVRELEQRMEAASQNMAYETAGILRDQIQAVRRTLSPQNVSSLTGKDSDVIGFHREGDQIQVLILVIRSGQISGRSGSHFDGYELPDDEVLSSFIVQHYAEGTPIPTDLIVSCAVADQSALAELLSDRRGSKVRLTNPKRGSRREQADMADLNAKQLLEERLRDDDAIDKRLEAIATRLLLPRPPHRIECVDISHFGGTDTVAGISAVIDGQPSRRHGRTYTIKTVADGDDYGAMREVLSRRFKRALSGDEGWDAPDLLVVDGGRGQLSSALAVLEELGVADQPVVALAKERAEREGAETDRVYLPGRKNPIPLKAKVSPLQTLALARDEAHRLAIKFQRKSRRKNAVASELDRIDGVGPKMKSALLKHLGSLTRIRNSTVEEIATVPGVGPTLAMRIKEELATKDSNSPSGKK